MGDKKYAIMTIDLQNSFTKPGNPELTQANRKEVDNVASLLKEIPNIDKYIVTYNDDSEGEGKLSDKKILDAIKGQENVVFFQKGKPDAFAGGKEIKNGKGISFDLDKHLKANGITDLIIVGLNQNACALATMRSAIKKGFHVTTANSMIFNAGADDKGPKYQLGLSGRYSPDKFYIKQEKNHKLTIVESAKDIKKLINDKTSALDMDTKGDGKKAYFVLNEENASLVPADDSTIESNKVNIQIASSTFEHMPDDEYSL